MFVPVFALLADRQSGAGGDLLAQRRIGREHAEVTVAVSSRRGNQLGDTIDEFEWRQHQFGLAERSRPGQAVTQGFPRYDPLQPPGGVQGAGAIAQQALQPPAIEGADTNRPVDGKAAAVRPLRHRLRGRLVQQSPAYEQTQYALAQLLLHLCDINIGDVGLGKVQCVAGLIENAITDGKMKMQVSIEARSEMMQKKDCTDTGRVGENLIYQMGRHRRHPLAIARGANTAPLARVSNQKITAAMIAIRPGEATR